MKGSENMRLKQLLECIGCGTAIIVMNATNNKLMFMGNSEKFKNPDANLEVLNIYVERETLFIDVQ